MTTHGIVFEVLGVPVPQGSMRGFKVGGSVRITHSNAAPLRSWRDSVASAARDESVAAGIRFARPEPVKVKVEFRLQRPKSQTKAQRSVAYVATKPDLDKLARGVLDALTAAQVFDDDSQVAVLEVSKVYANDGLPLGALVVVSEQR